MVRLKLYYTGKTSMLSIFATTVIAICAAVVFSIDNSTVALALSAVVLLCTMILAINSSCREETYKLERLKVMCITSMALVCFHLCIAGIRVRKYFNQGERLAVMTLMILIVAQLTLVYTLHSTRSILRIMNEGKSSSRRSDANMPEKSLTQSTSAWV